MTDTRPEALKLLALIKEKLPDLVKLQADCDQEWEVEDYFYRFYHHSFKCYRIQSVTTKIVDTLRSLHPFADEDPSRKLDDDFESIIKSGTGVNFEHKHNQKWAEVTRPFFEAYSHARYMLDMIVKYGRDLESPPNLLPSGWASVLYLYGMR